jgi:cysteine-rich repeat protein
MTMTKRILTLLCASAVLGAVSTAHAGALPEFKCGGAKQTGVSKDESSQLGCYSKDALAPNPTVLGPCVTKAQTGLTTAFGKADTTASLKGSSCPGDPAVVGPAVDNCVASLRNTISSDGMGTIPSGQEKCASAKLKAAGKGAAGEVSCLAKETAKGGRCSVTTTTFCSLDTQCPSGETCVAVPPIKVCSGDGKTKCTDDTGCAVPGGSCVDACLFKARAKTAIALGKTDALDGAPCQALGTPAGIQANIDVVCVSTITGGLPGKPANVCGNGVIEAGNNETCDDGNARDGDGCPSSCHVDACTPVAGVTGAHVVYSADAGVTVAAVQIFVDYPEGKVSSPNVSHPFGVSGGAFDLGYGVNDAIAKNPPAALPATIMNISFQDTCQGSTAATTADFNCVVTDASDDTGQSLDVAANHITCTASVP